jgi:hypothetical protein
MKDFDMSWAEKSLNIMQEEVVHAPQKSVRKRSMKRLRKARNTGIDELLEEIRPREESLYSRQEALAIRESKERKELLELKGRLEQERASELQRR